MTGENELVGTTVRAQVRAITHVRRLADLLDRRPDLQGVHPPADVTAEAVRWSV